MLYQSFSGDASGSSGTFTQRGGSLIAEAGPLFYVTNATGTIALTKVVLSAASGTLLQAAADRWGTSGSNGGTAKLTDEAQILRGDAVVDGISAAELTLKNGSTLTGAVDNAHTARSVAVALDATSTWTVTADSYVTTLSGLEGTSGTTITNIVGNGHTVHYSAAANSALGAKTYALQGGGQLVPG